MAKKQPPRPPIEKTHVIYSVAASADGFIADRDGSVDWLHAAMVKGEGYGLEEFTASIDAVLMGSRTYEQSLGMGGVGSKTPCWVFSRRPMSGKGVTITGEEPRVIVAELAALGFRRTWLMGGGRLASSFLADDLIDEIFIGLMPVVLGEGIPLFAGGIVTTHLVLTDKVEFKGGALGLTYKPRGR